MPQFTETLSIYAPTDALLADANSVPGEVMLVRANVKGNLQRGATLDVQDAQGVVGINNTLFAYGYFDIKAADVLLNRSLVLDGQNVVWLIRNAPSVRNRFPATAHVKCLLERLDLRPQGLPPA